MVVLLRRHGRDAKDAAQHAVDQLDPHADVDERNTPFDQPLDDQPLGLAPVEADEDEIHRL